MDNSMILERWKDLDAQRAQKNRGKSGSTSTTGNSGVSTPNSTPTTSFSESIRESSAQTSDSWTVASDKPFTTPSTKNGGSVVPLWGEELASPVVTDIFKLIADIEQQPGRHQEALQIAESHAYAIEMELQNCRTTQELSAKRIRELEEKLRATEDQVKDQKRVIDNLKEDNVARNSRILDLEQSIRASQKPPNHQSTPMATRAEEKKPTFPPTVKKKVSSLFRREGSNYQSNRR